ncbi:hypothetical protein HMPREF0290_3023, partial [Corynebacterium efficiens YS-314]
MARTTAFLPGADIGVRSSDSGRVGAGGGSGEPNFGVPRYRLTTHAP